MVASNWKYSLCFSFWKTQYSQRFRYTCKRHLWYIKAVLGQLFLQPSLNKPDYMKAYIKTTFLKKKIALEYLHSQHYEKGAKYNDL